MMATREPRMRCDRCTDHTEPVRRCVWTSRACNKERSTLRLCAACYRAAAAMFDQWQPLPHFVLKKCGMRPSQSTYEEAISDLNTVMWQCCLRFDPQLGYKFNTYAVSSMLQALKTFHRNRNRKGFSGNSNVTAEVGVMPIESERWDGDYSIIETLADEAVTADELLHRMERKQFIEKVLGRINNRYAFVLRSRLLTTPVWTLAEVAEQLNVTRERVRQLEAKAKKRFRLVVAEMGGEQLLEAVL